MSNADIPARLAAYGGVVTVVRLALTKTDTVTGLPSFSVETKAKDPRYTWFRRQFGTRCYELDALNPVELRRRVTEAIANRIDPTAWEMADIAEQAEHESLVAVLSKWPTTISSFPSSGSRTGMTEPSSSSKLPRSVVS